MGAINSIETDNLKLSFGKTDVLKGVDLFVPNGCVYALIGLNGSGKTTLLRVLSGLIKAHGGTAQISGEKVLHGKSIGKISFMFEPSPSDGKLTAWQNLKLKCLVLGEPTEQIDELLKKVGLIKDNKLVKRYSKGMKKRLELAYALVGNPEVLILDEPFDGLDIEGIDALREIIGEFKKQGKTVFLTEHDFSLIENIADYFGVLFNGRNSCPSLCDRYRKGLRLR